MKAVQLSLFKPTSQIDCYLQDGCIIAYDTDAETISKVCRFELESGIRPKVVIPKQSEFVILPRLVRAGYKIRIL